METLVHCTKHKIFWFADNHKICPMCEYQKEMKFHIIKSSMELFKPTDSAEDQKVNMEFVKMFMELAN